MRQVVVIGAGVVGASAALRLSERGANVTVVDAGDPAGGTSSVSFAWINAASKRPRAYFDLNAAGITAYRRLQAEWGGSTDWLHLTGHLEWAGDEAGWRAIDDKVAEARAWGYAATRLTAERVLRSLEPDLRIDPRSVPEIIFYPDEAYADVPVMVGELLKRACSLGAVVRSHDPVIGIDTASGRVAAVRLASGESVSADMVLCCCGAWTNEVAAMVGAHIPLVSPEAGGSPAVGMLLLTSPVAAAVRRVITTPEINLRPAGGGRLLLHDTRFDRTVEHDTPTDSPPAAAAEAVVRLRRVLRYTDAARIEGARIGIRPLPRDGSSVVGWTGRVDGFYVIATHSAVTMGPLLGGLAATEMLEDQAQPLLTPFRPQRFAEKEAGG